MDLIYEAYGAGLSNENRHPQIVMKELGITYKKSEGVAIRDAWFFMTVVMYLKNFLSL